MGSLSTSMHIANNMNIEATALGAVRSQGRQEMAQHDS